jgi:hypothetical protein
VGGAAYERMECTVKDGSRMYCFMKEDYQQWGEVLLIGEGHEQQGT